MPSEKEFINQQKEKLEKEKSSIENSLKSFATKDKKLKGDWDVKFPQLNSENLDDSADEVEEYENLLPVEFSLENRLRDIDSAMANIKNGSYGKCEKCKQEIPKERLTIYPAARACNKCK